MDDDLDFAFLALHFIGCDDSMGRLTQSLVDLGKGLAFFDRMDGCGDLHLFIDHTLYPGHILLEYFSLLECPDRLFDIALALAQQQHATGITIQSV